MVVYITGDCHADFRKFSTDNFPEQKEMTRDDYVIVRSDFGVWYDTKEEHYWVKWLSRKPFTLLFIDGNHENFDRLYGDEFPIVDFNGGKVHRIRENVFHLMRGRVFELCGKKSFAFGGASSHNIDDGILDMDDFDDYDEFRKTANRWYNTGKMFRINHISWWKLELPGEEEMQFGLKTLEKHGNKADFIISHCCPQHIASLFSHGCYQPDDLTRYFNVVADTVDFSKWFFGHYHNNQVVMSKFIMPYEQVVRRV